MKCMRFIWILLVVNCITFQYGNPSHTVSLNKGAHGWYSQEQVVGSDHPFGESCIQNYFGLVSFGDARYERIQESVKFKTIFSVDHIYKTQYLFYQELCVRVYGK